MKPDPAASWNSGCSCGSRGMNCSKPGGSYGRTCSLGSLCRPYLTKTKLGFTASATEAKASLRFWRPATSAGGRVAVVSAA